MALTSGAGGAAGGSDGQSEAAHESRLRVETLPLPELWRSAVAEPPARVREGGGVSLPLCCWVGKRFPTGDPT